VNPRSRRRRAGLVALALVVSLGHWAVMRLLPELRIGDGSAERMPKRIEVAFVRELAPAAPPPPPVVVARKAPKAPKARPKPVPAPAEAASAPAAEDSAAQALAQLPPLPVAEPEPTPEPTPTPVEEAPAPTTPQPEAVAAAASAASAASAFEWPPSTRVSYKLSGNYRGEVVGNAQVEWVRAGSRYQVHLDVWVGAQAAPLVGRRMTSDG
jgi:hypothetical protein